MEQNDIMMNEIVVTPPNPDGPEPVFIPTGIGCLGAGCGVECGGAGCAGLGGGAGCGGACAGGVCGGSCKP